MAAWTVIRAPSWARLPAGRRSGASAACVLELGGVRVGFKSDSAGIISVLERRYGPFAVAGTASSRRTTGKGSRCLFEAREADRRELPFRPSVVKEGPILTLKRGDFRARLDLAAGKGELAAAPDEQALDAFLRSLISPLLLREGGLMLHSAGLIKGGRAHVFIGKSGAGKSTLSRLAAASGRAEVISDEINLLRPGKNGWLVHGSPFWGEMRAAGRPGAWPLGGVYTLAKARDNALLPCGAGGALKLLLRCLVNFEKGAEAGALALRNACGLLEWMRPSRLEFSKRDSSFLELI